MSLVLTPAAADGLPYWTADGGHARWLAVTHGSFGSHSDFQAVLAPIADHYNILLWDLPGHSAASEQRPATRLEAAAEKLAAIMRHASVGAAYQLGFSFGGMVAQKLARLHPQMTSALIAYACVPITAAKMPAPWVVHALTQLQFALTPWPTFCAAFATQVSAREDLQRAFAEKMRAHPARLRNAIYEAMIYGASYEPAFAYAMPVAQIKGGCDDRFPGAKAAMDAWGAALPPDLVETIPEAGHLAHKEQPDAFSAALLRVLRRLDARLA